MRLTMKTYTDAGQRIQRQPETETASELTQPGKQSAMRQHRHAARRGSQSA